MKGFDDTRAVRTGTTGKAWSVVGLAAFTQAINQIDKSVLGLAAEPIMRELSLSPTQYGFVAGSIFVLFAVGGLFTALYAAPRYAPRHILMVLLLVWSLSQLPIVFAASLTVLVACRMVLGAAEGGGPAMCVNVCHEWFPDEKRDVPTATILAGGIVGALVAAPTLTYLIGAHGWRSAFLACSAAGFVALLAWTSLRSDGPQASRPVASGPRPAGEIGLFRLLLDRTVLGNILVGLCAYAIVGFMFAWLALYVRNQLGLTPMRGGWALAVVYLGQGLLLLAVSILARRLLASGLGSRIARSWVIAGCLALCAVCFVTVGFVGGVAARLVLITLATGLPGSIYPLCTAMIGEVAPPAERNRLMTVAMAIMTLSAIVSPPVAGALIDLSVPYGWRPALLLMAAIAALGAGLALVMLHPDRSMAARVARSARERPFQV